LLRGKADPNTRLINGERIGDNWENLTWKFTTKVVDQDMTP
jgi:hypothetical protein